MNYDSDINTLINSPNLQERRKFAWLILILPFVIGSLRASNERFSLFKAFDVDKLLSQIGIGDSFLNLFLATITTKFILILFPMLVIIFLELSNPKSISNGLFRNTSFGRIKRSRGFRFADVWYFFFNLLIGQFPLIGTLLTFGLANIYSPIGSWFHSLYQSIVPLPSSEIIGSVIFLVAILLDDMVKYFNHRIAHEIGFIWDFHEFHHSATEMTILNKDRNILLQDIFTTPITLPISILSGLLLNEYVTQGFVIPFYIYSFYIALDFFGALVGHSSLKVIYPKPLNYIFMSPSLHWLHHSINPSHYNCNYGMNFAFWDRLFGSYLDESNIKDIMGFGVKGTQYNKKHPLYAYSILPIIKIIRRVKMIVS